MDTTPTVLVAGYDPDLRATVEAAFRMNGAVQIRSAASGTDVSEALVSHAPDVVVLDATRGDTLALAALRRMYGRAERQAPAVVLISNEQHDPERLRLYAQFDISGVVTTWRDGDLPARIGALTGLNLTSDLPATPPNEAYGGPHADRSVALMWHAAGVSVPRSMV